jgi:hypothetical protein
MLKISPGIVNYVEDVYKILIITVFGSTIALEAKIIDFSFL